MRILTTMLTLMLLVTACGSGDAENSSETPETKPPFEINEGDARVGINGELVDVVETIAYWSNNDKRLTVILTTFALTDEQRATMYEPWPFEEPWHFNLDTDQPYVDLAFTFKDASEGITADNLDQWRMVFFNFEGDVHEPMNFVELGDNGLHHLAGTAKIGEEITLQLDEEKSTSGIGKNKTVEVRYQVQVNSRFKMDNLK